MTIVRLTPAEKAAITRKWRRASAKARVNGLNYLNGLNVLNCVLGWLQCRGVVDLAVKRNNRSGGVVLPASGATKDGVKAVSNGSGER